MWFVLFFIRAGNFVCRIIGETCVGVFESRVQGEVLGSKKIEVT